MRFCPDMLQTYCLPEGLCFMIDDQAQNPDGAVSNAEMHCWTPHDAHVYFADSKTAVR